LRREFKEETNLDIDVGNIIDGRIEKTSDRTKIIITFEVTSAQGEIRLNSESEEYGCSPRFLAILFTIIPSICQRKTLIPTNQPNRT
jgi:8-oxo-dGTP pyrophosphatase MutT (NUDIX family)